MKKKKSPVPIVLLLIVCVAAVGIITFITNRQKPSDAVMDGSEYFGITENDQVALVVDGQLAKMAALEIEGILYIDYDTVTQYMNQRFYWDKDSNKMIYAFPTSVEETDLSGNAAGYRMEGDTLYLSMDTIAQHTDMEYQEYSDPRRLVVRTQWDGLSAVMASENTQVRYRGGIKSDILEEVPKGTPLVVVDDSFEDWVQVTTDQGYTGFVSKNSVGPVESYTPEHTSTVPEYTSLTRDYKINMVWHQTTSQAANNTVSDMLANVHGVNVIAPTWFFINDTAGNLQDISSSSYVETVHGLGMEVWAVLNDFDGNINSNEDTYAVLSSSEKRKSIVAALMDAVLEKNIDGINVDIEKVSEECAPHYLQFIRELSASCRSNEIVLSVDNYVPREYSAYYDRGEQGKVADYVVIMGYDEHYAGSEEAGSVASISFVRDGIERTLLEVPASKVINGIPFYTRLWVTDRSSGMLSSEAGGMDKAEEWMMQYNMEKYWDETTGQNYAETETDAGLYQIWLEDEASVEEKMKLIQEYDLAGVAAWKLGFERADIWDIILGYLS